MEKKDVKVFDDIFDCLNQELLGKALRQVRAYVNANPYLMYDDGLDDIERDYGLMLDYMERGYADERRNQVYETLLMRLYTFVGNLFLSFMIKNNSFFGDLSRRSANGSFANERVKLVLESFVTDMAMLSLEPDDTREAKMQKIYADHTRFMQQLFCHLVVSRQWGEPDSRFYTELLLSPLVDSTDAQLIVSALTVAQVNIMDPRKFATLINVYLNSHDEHIRQKALVGWVFSFTTAGTELPPVKRLILDTIKDMSVVADLADLQKQMIFCTNAERDNDTIRKDIMPDIIRNNNLNVTRFGVTEKDETDDDIFDPGAADRRMEKMEDSFRKMMDMQKAGSDIYFGGFSQMKRFAFFYNPANWFMPFFRQHPDISGAAGKVKNTRLLENLLQNNMFCESDKYSFAIALSSIVDHLPAGIVDILGSKESLGPDVAPENLTPAYVRRLILQDLYRFFKLYYPQSTDMLNPFKANNVVFLVEWPLCDRHTEKAVSEINGVLLDTASFMFKQKNKDGMRAVLDAYDDDGGDGDARYWLLDGLYHLELDHDPIMAVTSLSISNKERPGVRRTLSLLARAYFEEGRYDEASDTYAELCRIDPDSRTAQLNYSIALSKAKRYDDASALLYKLTFESEGDANVTRVLAWTLMGQNKLEQAGKEYDRLISGSDTETGDYLNAGYCHWFMGDTAGAVSLFKQFISLSDKPDTHIDIESEMDKDRDIMADHGISDIDFNLMVDILRR